MVTGTNALLREREKKRERQLEHQSPSSKLISSQRLLLPMLSHDRQMSTGALERITHIHTTTNPKPGHINIHKSCTLSRKDKQCYFSIIFCNSVLRMFAYLSV